MEMAQIEGRGQKLKEEIEMIKNHVNLNQNKVKVVQEDIERLKATILQIEEEQTQCDQSLRKISEEQVAKERELQRLREHLNYMKGCQQDTRNKNNIITSLLKAQREGSLQGIFGRLGDLGTIDQQYDCAITTSCGVLDHIVVDNIINAEKCIQFLRDHRIGSGKFICLDKIIQQNKNQREKPFNPPEGSLRLYDLIRSSDEKFKDAFYFGLKDTLVCDTLDLATRIAYGQFRHRVVTLKGDLIEKSGTMSGGGKPRTGGMSTVIVPEFTEDQINEVQQQVNALQTEVQKLREERPHLDELKRKNQQRLQQNQIQLQKAEIEHNQFKQTLGQLEFKFGQLNKELEKAQADDLRVEKLRKEIQDDSNFLSDLNPKID